MLRDDFFLSDSGRDAMGEEADLYRTNGASAPHRRCQNDGHLDFSCVYTMFGAISSFESNGSILKGKVPAMLTVLRCLQGILPMIRLKRA